MLIDLRVENHRSIRDEQVLTTEAVGANDANDLRPRRIAASSKPLLPALALYGANASGKSNVLSALAFMRGTVIDSYRLWLPESEIPREPFAGGGKPAEPSLFELKMVVGDVRYQYGFVADDRRFLEEWLYAWPRGRRQTWFEREGDRFSFGHSLSGDNRLIERNTRDNALFLSTAAQLAHPQLRAIYAWFFLISGTDGMTRQRRGPKRLRRRLIREMLSDAILEPGVLTIDPETEQAFIAELLRRADTGIEEVRETVVDPEDEPEIELRHSGNGTDYWLPLEVESNGTRALFSMAPLLHKKLSLGGLLVVDELEASLHPALAGQIVQLFNDPRANPKHAQLLFTTHDTHLLGGMLGEPALRRDQVWLTEKDAAGATCLYPLTDFRRRAPENVERGYLQGRFGAIPFLDDLIAPSAAPISDGE